MANPYDDVVATYAGGSGSPTPDEANPYDTVVGDIATQQQTRARTVYEKALAGNPDKAAEAQRLAGVSGLPADAVERNLDEVRRKEQARMLDLARMAQDSPILARQLADPTFTKQAHDDLGTLEQVEQFFRDTGGSAKAGIFNTSKGAAGVFRAGFEFAAPALDVLEPVTAIGGNPLRRLAEGFAAQGEAAGKSAKAAAPKTEGNISSGFQSGIQSLTQNLLALPMAFLPGGQGAALGMMSAGTGGQAYQDAREKGLSMSQALPFAASQAAIEYATERIPLGDLVKDLKVGAPILRTITNQLKGEVFGEQIATVLQDMNEWAVLNPEKPFRDYIAERPDAAAQTLVATLVGTGGNIAVAKGIESATRRLMGDAYDAGLAEQGAAQLQASLQAAMASKLRERNPEQFRSLVQSMADSTEGAPAEVFVDAEVLNQLAPEFMAQLPQSVIDQLPDALTANDVVSIPVADVLTLTPGTPLEQMLVENARVGNPMAMSQVEAKAAGEQAQQYLAQEAERVIAQATDAQAMQESSDRVKQGLLEQLNTAGRFRPAVNEAYATWTTAFYTTMGGRMGLTPEEMAAKYPLKIAGQGDAGGVLGQSKTIDLSVPEDGNQLRDVKIGSTTITLNAKGRYFNPEGVVEVASVRTPAAKRGGGSARAAMQALVAQADAQGVVLKLDASPLDKKTNSAKLIAFYEALGFDRTGRSNNAVGDPEMIRTPRQPLAQTPTAQTDTPEFKNWFGDSKVVDASGKPLVMYHGTTGDFSEFRENSRGVHFVSPSPEWVGKFLVEEVGGIAEGANVIPAYVAASNPFDYENKKHVGVVAAHASLGSAAISQIKKGAWQRLEDRTLLATIKKLGFDGLYVNEEGIKNLAVFSPTQIKSATGNSGNFDPTNPNILKQSAFHGTPYKFDKFSLDHIGNGEGAQAFGWGLYFAGKKQVAEYYRRTLSDGSSHQTVYLNGQKLEENTPERHAASLLYFNDAREIKPLAKRWLKEAQDGDVAMADTAKKAGMAPAEYWGRLNDFVSRHKKKEVTFAKGQLYEVDIPEDDEMLQWHKPITSQPESVKKALKDSGLWKELKDNLSDFSAPMNTRGKLNGENIYAYLEWKLGSDKAASLRLSEIGIPGLKYPAGTIAGTGTGSGGFNYVVFDEDAVSILNTYYQGARGTFNPATLELALNENADLSTFLHESGHFFLEVMADLSSQPDAPADIQQDMAALLKWFGVPDMQTWNSYALDQKRPYHERFAESFEQYLLEGKAPSVELQPLFRKFAAWMKNVYRSLKGFIDSRVAVTSGGGELAQSVKAARADPTGKTSPITRKPIFELYDEKGGRIGLAHSYVTAEEAVAGFNAPKQAAPAAPTYTLPERELPKRSNWKQVKGQKFTALDEDDDFLYHITAAPNANGIRTDGLAPGGGGMFGGGYATYSAGKAFLTERSGVSFWKARVEDQLQAASDAPPATVVLRIPKAKVTSALTPDDVGTKDARARAYFATETLAQDPNAAGDPNIQLSDDIRQVFDRMLASEEQIAEAEKVAGLLPEADSTAEAVEKLTARSLRDLKWTVNARAREIKKLQAQAKELRKGVEAEVRAEVEQMPVYAARKFLRTDTKLAIADLEAIYAGEGDRFALLDWKPLVDQKLAGKTGQHPDIIADMFDFESGDAMVRAILDAEPISSVIEGMTDQRMLERHGDLIDDRAIAEAANEAVHNEARARALATELKAQADALGARAETGETNAKGSKVTVSVIAEAAKQFAANVISRTPLRDLKSRAWQHVAAERRAGKRWQEATAKGQTQDAIKAKQDQVLNNAAAKAAGEAQAEMRKILDFFKRVVKDNNEKTVEKGRDPDVVNAARAILGAYGIAPRAGKSALDYMDVLQKNDPAMFNALQPSVQAALNMAQPLDSLTMDELRSLHDEIQGMWYMAKRSRQMEVDGNLMDLEETADLLHERMTEIGIPDEIPGERGSITEAEELGIKLQFARAILRRVEQWSESLDGKFGGPFLRFVFQPIKAAADRYRTDKVKYRERLTELVKGIADKMPPGKIVAPELGYTFGNGKDSGTAELLHAMLHTGNDSNKRKLLLGRQWATENPDGTLDTSRWDAFMQRMHDSGTITQAHWEFAQGVWDLLEEMKPLAQKTHRDVYGRYFAEVTANPVATPFGEYRGGYVPAQTDSRLVKDAKLRELAEGENESMAYAFPSSPSGFTKGRVEYNQPLLLDLRALGQHMDKVLLFSHMQGVVTDVRRLLTRKNVSYGLNRIDPGAYEGMLIPWLNRAAKQIVETPVAGDRKLSRFLSAARSRAGMALMFGNISNTLQQITGFSLAAVKVKPALMMKATAQFIAHPKQMRATVAEASEFMKNRMLNEVSAMNDAVEQILVNPGLLERSQAWTQQHAYFLQTAMANTMEPIVWTAAYNQVIEQGASEQEARKFADGTIRQTQGSTLPEDISRFESGPAYGRVFTQFIGYFNMMANTNATAAKQITEELGVKKGAGKLLYVALAGMMAPIWVAEAIAVAMRGGPDDEDKDGYLDDWLAAVFGIGTLRGLVAQVPIVGQAAQLAVNRFNDNPADDKFSLSPAVSLIESTVSAPASVYKAIVADGSAMKAVKDSAAAATMITGLPIFAIARPLGYAVGVAEGKVEPTSAGDAVRGAISGTASKESKQP